MLMQHIGEFKRDAIITPLVVTMCMVFVVSGRMALIYLGANLIVAGDLNAGDLTSLLMYCINILMSLVMLSMTIVMITMSSASARRVVEVFTEQCDMPAAKRRSPSSIIGSPSDAAMQRLATYRRTPSSASDSRACNAFSKRMPWMPTSLAPTMFLAVSSKNTQRSAVRSKRVRASS